MTHRNWATHTIPAIRYMIIVISMVTLATVTTIVCITHIFCQVYNLKYMAITTPYNKLPVAM